MLLPLHCFLDGMHFIRVIVRVVYLSGHRLRIFKRPDGMSYHFLLCPDMHIASIFLAKSSFDSYLRYYNKDRRVFYLEQLEITLLCFVTWQISQWLCAHVQLIWQFLTPPLCDTCLWQRKRSVVRVTTTFWPAGQLDCVGMPAPKSGNDAGDFGVCSQRFSVRCGPSALEFERSFCCY